MNMFKFFFGIILSSGFMFGSIPDVEATSDDFGRLFTTPEERRNLQMLRYAEPEPEPEVEIAIEAFVEEIDEVGEEVEEVERPDIEGITLNGLVYRKDGKSTAWLNGSNSYEGSLASEYFRINADDINSDKISVTVPEVDLKFDLKVGETYEPNDERLIDIVENNDDIEISRN